MKWFVLILLLFLSFIIVRAQVGNVGINTNMPAAMLHVMDSSVLFTGAYPITSSPGSPPASGEGTRMMWYPDKAAFRAGVVHNASWDKDSIGIGSIAVGYSTKAKGYYSTATGIFTVASGYSSIAMGHGSKASGETSTAMGVNSLASGTYSIAMGNLTIASGIISTAMGYSSEASGNYSTATGLNTTASGGASVAIGTETTASNNQSMATGYNTTASGPHSLSMGFSTIASGDQSVASGHSSVASGRITIAAGLHTKSKSYAGTVIGTYNDSTNAANALEIHPDNRIFQIGNGTSDTIRSNAMTVLQNGKVGINTTAPTALFHVKDSSVVFTGAFPLPVSPSNPPVSGGGNRMMWYPDKSACRAGYVVNNRWDKDSVGVFSIALGYNTKAKGTASVAVGNGTLAIGHSSTAMGLTTQASGSNSTSMGITTLASGSASTAMGAVTRASGTNATAMGGSTRAIGSESLSTGFATVASGDQSATLGYYSSATGRVALAGGVRTKSKSYAGTVIGSYNDTTNAANPIDFHPDNRLFQIGNGDSEASRSNALTVLQNGNIGIATLTPAYLLDIGGRIRLRYGQGETAGIWYNKNDNSAKAGFIGTYANDNYLGMYGENGAGWAFVMNTSTGNVGLGTTAPAEKLNVVGNGLFTGTVTASCGVLVCSDIRYKKNIVPIQDALTSLQSLHGIYYHWDQEKFTDKAFDADRQIGFSAQELEDIYPEMVRTDSKGYKTVDYSRLTPVLVEAIKEQQEQIEMLSEQLKLLLKQGIEQQQ